MSMFEKFAQQANDVLIKPRRLPAPWAPSLAERVAGRAVLITGASSGIGRALAEAVAAAGATTLVVARRADERQLLHYFHRMVPESAAAKGIRPDDPSITSDCGENLNDTSVVRADRRGGSMPADVRAAADTARIES